MHGAMTHGDSVDQWIRFFHHPDRAVQLRALQVLVGIDDPRVTAVLLESFSRYGSYRGVVAALTRHREPTLVDSLLQHLTDPNLHVRAAVCEALGILQDRRATPSLVARLDDTHQVVRRAAAFALAALRDPQAADAVLRHYQERPEENINVRMGLSAVLKALDVPHEGPGVHARDPAPPITPDQAEATVDDAIPLPVVVTRHDLANFMREVHSTLRQLLNDGTSGYFYAETWPTLHTPTERPWKLGRGSGRRLRQRLKYLEADVLQTERRWPADSTNLPPEIVEQGPRILAHLKRIISILEANEDARPHQDEMRTAAREMQKFVEALPEKKVR